jgi:hypothetical protein
MKRFTIGRVALALLAAGVVGLSMAPVASAGGGNSANVKLCKSGGWQNLYNASTGLAFTSQGACVASGAHGGISSLTFSTTVSGGGWGAVSGFGLQPGSTVVVHYTFLGGQTFHPIGTVQLDGTFAAPNTLSCGAITNAFATATTSGGATITTPAVNSPC